MINLTMEQVWIIRLQVRRDQVAGDPGCCSLLGLVRKLLGKERKEKDHLDGDDKKWLHPTVAQGNQTKPKKKKNDPL